MGFRVAVVGVGMVGQEILKVLKAREFPVDEIKVLARQERIIQIGSEEYLVKKIAPAEFDEIQLALFAGTEGEKGAAVTYADEVVKRGGIVIDNGRDFRLKTGVPLVVPEVNAEALKKHQGIIANPNCSTIQLVMALAPIYQRAGLKRVIVSTYQAVSGSGRAGVAELETQVSHWVNKGSHPDPEFYPRKIAFNVIPEIGTFHDYKFTAEEWKLTRETAKIFGNSKVAVSATAVRVPVFRGHAESIYCETEKPIKNIARVQEWLSEFPGVVIANNTEGTGYHTPEEIAGEWPVYAGRIRKDPFSPNGLWLWVVADNLLKGAALNAVQIAEELIEMELVKD